MNNGFLAVLGLLARIDMNSTVETLSQYTMIVRLTKPIDTDTMYSILQWRFDHLEYTRVNNDKFLLSLGIDPA